MLCGLLLCGFLSVFATMSDVQGFFGLLSHSLSFKLDAGKETITGIWQNSKLVMKRKR